MEKITHSDGKEYTISPKYDKGGIILYADSAIAFRVEVRVLVDQSTVFADMIRDLNSASDLIHIPGVSAETLRAFLDILHGTELDEYLMRHAFGLCDTYGCHPAARKALDRLASSDFDLEYVGDAFAVASDHNDFGAAIKILTKAHSAEYAGYFSLRPFGPGGWEGEYALRIRSDWVWALSKAMAETTLPPDTSPEMEYRKQEYWDKIIAAFARNVMLTTVDE